MEQENEHARVDVRAVLEAARRAFLASPPPQRAEEACNEILARSGDDRPRFFRSLALDERLGAVRRLIEGAVLLREEDLPRARMMSQAATELAPLLAPVAGHAAVAKDLEAEAWAHHANLQRIAGDLQGAEEGWAPAQAALAQGSGDVDLCAEMLRMKANLRLDQRRFREAEDLLHEAIMRFETMLEDRHLAARSRILLGATRRIAGRPKQAFKTFCLAAADTDPARDPQQVLGLFHNQALILSDLGHKEQALAVMKRSWPLYAQLAGPVFLLRASWVRGRLHAGLHEYPHAVGFLEAARQGFVERQMSYDAALAALDLALVYARCRERRKVRELAQAMYPVFLSEGIEREASAALLLFVDAAREFRASPESITELIGEIEALGRRQSAEA
jgi:hypothetical protein